MVNKRDQNSATASQSGDDSEFLDEAIAQDMKTTETNRVIHQSDVIQEGIVGEVQEELGTSHVEGVLSEGQEEEMHPGHIADIFRHEHPEWDGDDSFAGVDGEGQEGVKSFRTGDGFEEAGEGDDSDTVFDDAVNDPGVEDTQLVQSEREALVHAEEEEHENAGRRVYKDEHQFDSGGLADGTELMGPEDQIERQA